MSQTNFLFYVLSVFSSRWAGYTTLSSTQHSPPHSRFSILISDKPFSSTFCGNRTLRCLCQPLLRPSSSSSSSSCSLCPPASLSPSEVSPVAPQTCGQHRPPCSPPPSRRRRLMAKAIRPLRKTNAWRCRCVNTGSSSLSGSPTSPGLATRWQELWSTLSRSCTCSWGCPSLQTASWRP